MRSDKNGHTTGKTEVLKISMKSNKFSVVFQLIQVFNLKITANFLNGKTILKKERNSLYLCIEMCTRVALIMLIDFKFFCLLLFHHKHKKNNKWKNLSFFLFFHLLSYLRY